MRETYVRAIVNQQTQRRWVTAVRTPNKSPSPTNMGDVITRSDRQSLRSSYSKIRIRRYLEGAYWKFTFSSFLHPKNWKQPCKSYNNKSTLTELHMNFCRSGCDQKQPIRSKQRDRNMFTHVDKNKGINISPPMSIVEPRLCFPNSTQGLLGEVEIVWRWKNVTCAVFSLDTPPFWAFTGHNRWKHQQRKNNLFFHQWS